MVIENNQYRQKADQINKLILIKVIQKVQFSLNFERIGDIVRHSTDGSSFHNAGSSYEIPFSSFIFVFLKQLVDFQLCLSFAASVLHMCRWFARLCTIYTIIKTWNTTMEECVTFSKVACLTLLRVTLLHMCFSRFLNCTNSTKLRKASRMCS